MLDGVYEKEDGEILMDFSRKQDIMRETTQEMSSKETGVFLK